jgi:hypothetical protein
LIGGIVIADVIETLKETERLLAGQLEAVRGALTSLEGGTSQPTHATQHAATTAPVRKRRRLSAKARKAISDAQKLRWAKQKAAGRK